MSDTSPSLAPRDLAAAAKSNPFAQFASSFKQATKDSKPVVNRAGQKRGAAVKFTSAETKRKIGDGKETTASASAATVPKSGLVRWLDQGNGDRPGYEDAREYLISGPPYKGDSDFSSKEALKDLGAKWCPNPLKEKGAKDGVCPGWWSAMDIKDLEALIGAPRNEKRKRIWKAIDVSDSQHDAMMRLMREYEGHQLVEAEQAEKKRKADAVASSSRAEAHKEALKNSNLQPDSEEDIKRLKDDYDVDWSLEMAMKAQASACLGPQMTTAIGRVLRGLKHNIINSEQARVGNFEGAALARRARARVQQQQAVGHEAAVVDASDMIDEEINYRLLPAPTSGCSGCFMFGNTNPNHIPVPTAAEWEKLQDETEDAVRATIVCKDADATFPATRRTYCTGCITELLEQFLECSCHGCTWSKCSTCNVLCCSEQACECADREKWSRLQNTAVREHKKRVDAAEQSIIDSGMGAGGPSSNPHGEWDDDDYQTGAPLTDTGEGAGACGDAPLMMDNWLHER